MRVDDEIVPSCSPLDRSKDKECSWAAKDAERGREAEEDGDLDEGGSYEGDSSASDDDDEDADDGMCKCANRL